MASHPLVFKHKALISCIRYFLGNTQAGSVAQLNTHREVVGLYQGMALAFAGLFLQRHPRMIAGLIFPAGALGALVLAGAFAWVAFFQRRFDRQGGPREFTPPIHGKGNDWVLVLDDAAQGFPPPGQQFPEP